MCDSDRKKPKLPFVNLHAHSTFSVFDGFGMPSEYMEYAYQNGMDAHALTDHGKCNGMAHQILHEDKMRKEGKHLKAIKGVEGYWIPSISDWEKEYEKYKSLDEKEKRKAKKKEKEQGLQDDSQESHAKKSKYNNVLNHRRHVTILVKNDVGLKNLFRMVSESHSKRNFYRFPRIDNESFRKYNEGLIITSGCAGGIFGAEVFKCEDPNEALENMRKISYELLDIFGDDFYGEIQFNNLSEQHILNQCVLQLSKEIGFKVIATADCHYPTKDSWKNRELYRRLGYLNRTSKPSWLSDGLPCNVEEIGFELYPKNGDEMFESHNNYASEVGILDSYEEEEIIKAIKESHNIAMNKIEDVRFERNVKLPSFAVPKNKTPDEALWESSLRALEDKGLVDNKEYCDRLKEEFDVISYQGFSQYFLAMKTMTDYAHEHYICGPGRGSAGGSLIAYVLNITQVDPIKHELLFSRFLTKNSSGMPDIDFDVSDRIGFVEKLIERYGKNTVVPITSFNKMGLRSLIKDISKFYGIDFAEVNRVTSTMELEATPAIKIERGQKAGVLIPAATFDEILRNSKILQGFLSKYPHVSEQIVKLRGSIRSTSRHAGGVLVCEDLNENMPLIQSGGVTQTPWSEGIAGRYLEPLGFIKFDFLGLSTLKVIEDCIELVLKRQGREHSKKSVIEYYADKLHPDKLDLNDSTVYKNVFHDGNFIDTFQFTQKNAQEYCTRIKPNSILEMAIITSLQRPGPLEAGVDVSYERVISGFSEPHYEHPIIEQVLSKTKGFIVFQEQIALLGNQLGKDISLDEGNDIRKLIVKRGLPPEKKEKLDSLYLRFVSGCIEKGIPESVGVDFWEKIKFFSKYGLTLSHAVAYCILSYQCAYLYTYHPAEWAAAVLTNAKEEEKSLKIDIARSLGFKIELPSINKSGDKWEIDEEGKLLQPLSTIKGLGLKAKDEIIKHRPFSKIEDLIYNENIDKRRVNKKTVKALLLSNSMSSLMDERFSNQRHFYEVVAENRPKKEKDFAEAIEKNKDIEDFSEPEKIQNIIDILGVFPFQDIISQEKIKWLQDNFVPVISEFDPELGVCWGVVKGFKLKKTKTNKFYLELEIIDKTLKITKMRCWGFKPNQDAGKIQRFGAYLIEPDYSKDWGFSTRSISKSFRKI